MYAIRSYYAFNLAYLKDLTKSTAAEDLLKIYLGSDMPVKIEYEVSGSKLVFRITSYNVCYTKLLRKSPFAPLVIA